MKYTYSSRELSGGVKDASEKEVATGRDLFDGRAGQSPFLRNASGRVLVILVAATAALYFLMGGVFLQVLLPVVVFFFQSALIELMGALFRRRRVLGERDAARKLTNDRRLNMVLWTGEWALLALGLILWTFWLRAILNF